MSILKTTKTFTRYKISDLEMNNLEILEKLNTYKIKDTTDLTQDTIFGWSSLLNTYDPNFEDISFKTGTYITLSMRVDQKKVPGTLLKKEIHCTEKSIMSERGLKKLPCSLKIEIKEACINNLLAKMKAIPNDFDVVLDVSSNTGYLFTTNKVAREIFEVLMKETFGVQIEMINPFTMSLNYFEESKIESITQTNFS